MLSYLICCFKSYYAQVEIAYSCIDFILHVYALICFVHLQIAFLVLYTIYMYQRTYVICKVCTSVENELSLFNTSLVFTVGVVFT